MGEKHAHRKSKSKIMTGPQHITSSIQQNYIEVLRVLPGTFT